MSLKKTILTAVILASISGMSITANADASAEITLQGIITKSTCDVVINGGKPTLFVGTFKSTDMTAANTMYGDTKMPVALKDCQADETGSIVIQGLTSIGNNDKNIFVGEDKDTVGFMIKNGTNVIANKGSVNIEAKKDGLVTQEFSVGMASTTTSVAGGSYSAPILVSYVVN